MNIKKILKKNWLLIVIILLATCFRFYKLGQYPIHLTNDEAALGYNAYSILKTGRDEHGVLMPVIFKSFGDWKPGLYVYLAVPSVAVFGLTEFATRAPSALMGVLVVYLTYLLVSKLFDNKKLALSSAFVLAILPWHIHFSRGAWEANVALTILLAALLLFLYALERPKYLVASAALFALTLWTYQSAKLASLLPLIGLCIFNYKKVLKIPKKNFVTAFIVGAVISAPVVLSVFDGKAGRIEVMSVFSYTRPQSYIEQTVLSQENISQNSSVFRLYHSETLNLFKGVLGRYFNYFGGRFLFFEGDWSNARHSVPNSGYFLLIEILTLLVGFYQFFKRSGKKEFAFILFWLAVAPIPAALTRDSVHGVRSLNMAVPLSIICGAGLVLVCDYFRKKNYLIKYSGLAILAIAFVYSMTIYLDAYYVQNPVDNASNYLYGYRETVKKVTALQGQYKTIVFDQSFDQPYIFFLFYNKYDPAKFQQNKSYQEGVNGDVGFVTKLDNIEFRPINWSGDKELDSTLLVGKVTAFPPYEINKPEDYNVDTVYYPDKNPAFLLVNKK